MNSFLPILALMFLVFASPLAGAEASVKPLTNRDVLKMLEANLPESVIVAKIRGESTDFDTSTDALIELHKNGVTEQVLVAIVNAKTKPAAENVAKASSPAPAETAAGGSTPPAATPPVERRDSLSYGMATGTVKKGVTTQEEILERFGGPSVMTTDREGVEVWMYDKTTSTVSSSAKQSTAGTTKSEAEVMAGFLGIPLVAGVAGAKAKAREDTRVETESAGHVTRSVKTVTFIIKFNPDKTVKDYSVRQASF